MLNICRQLTQKDPDLDIRILMTKGRLSYSLLNLHDDLSVHESKIVVQRDPTYRGIKVKLRNSIFVSVVVYLQLTIRYYELRKLLNTFSFDTALITGDRTLSTEAMVHKYCKRRNITTLIPYLTYSGKEPTLKLRQKRGKRHSVFLKDSINNYLISKLFPRQVEKFEGGKYLFFKASDTLAHYMFGTLPDNPWVFGSSSEALICVDNKKTMHRYLSNGIPEKRLVLAGHLSFDTLHNVWVNKAEVLTKLCQKYDLDQRHKSIIISLPQLKEHGLTSDEVHWSQINFLLKTLSATRENVFVSLHPKMNPLEYGPVCSKYCVTLVEERLDKILPIADTFVAFYSSTVYWSLLMNIPTLVFDFLDYRYDMFDGLDGLIFCYEATALPQAIDRTLHGKVDFTNSNELLSRETIFDGKTIDRYREIIYNY